MGMGEYILAIKSSVMFKDGEFEGVKTIEEKDLMPIILENGEYVIRTPALEEDNSWQQPITYVWLVNPKSKKIFLYKRAKTGNEGRLYDKYSGGVGGHIDKNTDETAFNPIIAAMFRELREETTMNKYPEPKIVGFIKLKGGVEDVHIGILAIAETLEEVRPAEDMDSGKFYSIEEAESLIKNSKNNIERWTIASWPIIKEYLSK